MDDQVLLYDSIICRLCAEENDNGILLFSSDENEPDLSNMINRYLPLKVFNDGKLPQTICPGCNIQLDALVQFMELIIAGQDKIRELWKNQLENVRRKEKDRAFVDKELFNTDSNIGSLAIFPVADTGKEILFQIMPDGTLYAPNHEMTLKVEGLEKPKRKRGRPPKPPQDKLEQIEVKDDPLPEPEEEFEEDHDGRRRRRRKVPTRYLEAVQGKELERMFREEGVIDEGEDTNDEDELPDEKVSPIVEENGDEVIGHLENKEGQDLGELVVVNKGKNKFRSKGKKKKNFTCEICGRGFMHHGRYVMHQSFHKGIKFECTACNELFNSKESLADHHKESGHSGQGIVESLENVNDECLPEDPLQTEEIPEPMPETPPIDVPSPQSKLPTKFLCNLCNKTFMSKQSYEVHQKAVHEGQKPFQCAKCDRSFAYQASLRGHMASHEQKTDKGYACDVCDKVFNHPSSVVYHKESEHNNGRRFVCNKCGKSFKHKQLLQRHQLVHSDDRPFSCKACGATFKTRANLMNHQPTHTGIKKYFCQQCGQLFAHKTSLTLHYRWHSGQKPYECAICKKAFSQKGNLEEHKRIHTGEKPFSCEFCDRKFTTSSQFKLHVKRHTGERPWSCEYCSKSFLHKDTWKCHMRRHRNEKPYQCQSCLRGFTEQWALKKHLRLHTGEKPYVCEFCNKAFADCSNLTKHKKVHRHIKQPLDDSVQTISTEGNQIFYVTYQDAADSSDIPTLVHILEDPTPLQTSNTSLANSSDSLELLNTQDQAPELSLAPFDDTPELSIPNEQLQVTDEEGSPIYFTSHDGRQFRVTTFDGENLQVALDDGTIIPIQLNVENGKAVAIELPQLTESDLPEKVFETDEQIDQQVMDATSNGTMDNDVSNLIDESVQFMTEDGQNVCLVTSYNIDSDNISSSYLPLT